MISGIYFSYFLYFFDLSQYVNVYIVSMKFSYSSFLLSFTGDVVFLIASS